MKIIFATIYPVKIPFTELFSHSLHSHMFSDSIILKLTTDKGITGYGEGVARPYVTGETVEKSLDYIQKVLLPVIINKTLDNIDLNKPFNFLLSINKLLNINESSDIIKWNAAKTAVELALIDCHLKEQKISLNHILPNDINEVIYSGVISSGTIEKTEKMAKQMKALDLKYIKIKVGIKDDYKRIAIIREIMNPSVSLRLDANGAFNLKTALDFITSISEFNIDCIEQPIPKGNISELSKLKLDSQIPIMVDESIITIDDAKELIENDACDYFNLRLSKCGGIYNTLMIAEIAKKANIGLQLGCQVGETAILSAAGRFVAAYLNNLKFIEGSYGKYLLSEDVSRNDIRFGKGGKAPTLNANGLGIDIMEDCLIKYATKIIEL
ncbi:MAG: enolase C-terminal domain-like protein [Cyanobacteriota bacterium]